MYEYAKLKALDWRSTVASSDTTLFLKRLLPDLAALLFPFRLALVAHTLRAVRLDLIVRTPPELLLETTSGSPGPPFQEPQPRFPAI